MKKIGLLLATLSTVTLLASCGSISQPAPVPTPTPTPTPAYSAAGTWDMWTRNADNDPWVPIGNIKLTQASDGTLAGQYEYPGNPPAPVLGSSSGTLKIQYDANTILNISGAFSGNTFTGTGTGYIKDPATNQVAAIALLNIKLERRPANLALPRK